MATMMPTNGAHTGLAVSSCGDSGSGGPCHLLMLFFRVFPIISIYDGGIELTPPGR